MTGTDWLTAIGILLSGAVIGFMFLYVTTAKKSGPSAKEPNVPPSLPLAVRDLEARRDVLVAQLGELRDIGGSDAERALLEQQAADVLRQLDGLAPVAPAATRAQRPVASRGPATPATTAPPLPVAIQQQPAGALKGFLWGVGSAAAIAGLVFFVINQAKARDAGGSLTSGTAAGAPPLAP